MSGWGRARVAANLLLLVVVADARRRADYVGASTLSEVVEVHDARHDVACTHADEVGRAMLRFLEAKDEPANWALHVAGDAVRSARIALCVNTGRGGRGRTAPDLTLRSGAKRPAPVDGDGDVDSAEASELQPRKKAHVGTSPDTLMLFHPIYLSWVQKAHVETSSPDTVVWSILVAMLERGESAHKTQARAPPASVSSRPKLSSNFENQPAPLGIDMLYWSLQPEELALHIRSLFACVMVKENLWCPTCLF
ncbi:hypothetical protein GGX14DRAFT_595896 [Mycena pura]|uniref:Uncharacterized protein n=1 Tax=Mycena pura TaxID=153505 RepID=A0AAD6UQF0_9AGAR|nr:hypothetical protein GGX14DRAFT_595896 [Mycena pura]